MFSSPLFRFFAGTDVFVSYRWREDSKQYALRLTEELEKRGLNCFIDEKGLSRGEVVPTSLRTAIRRSRMFVLVAGDDLDSSTWIPKELEVAQEFDRKIVPVNIDGTLDRMDLDDSRWTPLKDRSRVEESAEALAEHIPSEHVPVQIDGAYDFTRVRVKGIRVLFGAGVIFFAVSIFAIFSAVQAVRIRDNAQIEIGSLQQKQDQLNKDIAQALIEKKTAEDGAKQAIDEKNTAIEDRKTAIGDRDTARQQAKDAEKAKKAAEEGARQAIAEKNTAIEERKTAIGARDTALEQAKDAETKKAQAESDARVARADAEEQTKLGADQLRLKGYVSALAAGDRTSAMLSIRDFTTDDKTEGWKDAAVSVLQNPLPVWQADETILDFERDTGRLLSYTSSRGFVIRWIADPQRFIQLGGAGPLVDNGFDRARITWSPKGNFLGMSLRSNLGVWNLDHPEKPILILKHGFLREFSSHSKLLAVANGNTVEFWRLGETAEQVGQRDLGGSIWHVQWLPDRDTVACVVKKDSGQQGLFEVDQDHEIKLADGDYLIDYSISQWQQLLTRSFDKEKHQMIYRVKALDSSGKEFELRLPGRSIDFRMNLLTAGENGHFVLVHSRGSLWLADLRKPDVAPVEISKQLPEDSEFQPLLNDKLLVSAKEKTFVQDKESAKFLVFDLNNPSAVHVLERDPKRPKDFAVSPDGNWFATPKGFLDLRNGYKFGLPSSMQLRYYEIGNVVFSPDSDRLAARLNNSKLIVIDLNQPTKLQTIDQPGRDDPSGPPFVVWGSSKTGELMTMAEGNVRLWKLNSRAGADVGDLWYLFPLALSSNGNIAWLGGGGIGGPVGGGWSIEAWQATRPAVRISSIDVSSYIKELAVNEQQTAMVAITGVPDQKQGGADLLAQMVQYWTMNNTTDLRPVKINDPVFESASLSRDSLRVIGIRKNVPPTIWEPPFEKPVITLPTKGNFRKGVLSGNGRFAALLGRASSDYDLIEVWDLSSQQPTQIASYTVPGFGNKSFDLAVSNNGRTVISYGAGPGYEFSAAAPNGKPLRGSENGTRHLEFSPSDQKIIATLYSGQAVIWNVDQPETPELVMSNFSTPLGLARFAKKDDQVITATSGGHIQVWDVTSSGLRQALNQTTPLCMTFGQREKYFGLRRAVADDKAALCKP